MKLPLSFISLLLAGTLTLQAQTQVGKYRPGVDAEGITYFLPRTGLHFVFTLTRTTYHPGEFAPYAERYLRLSDVPQREEDEWTLTDVALETFGEANEKQAFTIKLNPKTSAPFVALAEDGRLLAINADAPKARRLTPHSQTVTEAAPKTTEDFKSEEILSAGSRSKMAELAAAEIYDIRQNRNALVKGQADFMPQDGEQLRLMLEQLDKQEQRLLQLFTGTKQVETHVVVRDLIPTKTIREDVFLRISRFLGVVEADDLAGEPLVLNLRAHPLPVKEQEADKGKAKKPEDVQDVRYTVPNNVDITLQYRGEDILKKTIPMAQFGRIEHLGGELFNKKTTTHITFSPETGGILRLTSDEK